MDPIEGMKIASVHVPAADKNDTSPKNSGADRTSFKDVLKDKLETDTEMKASEVASAKAPVRERMEAFVTDVFSDEKALDRAMNRAATGASMNNGELLELQALMYGYAQKVDIATKVVEKAAGGLKQLMQTQV
jgi:hypothetical protein